MSQTIFADINPAATSGTQLATHLNDFKAALMSGMSGTARPAETLAGGYWVDITNDPTYWSYKMYTGAADVEIFRLNLTTATASITGADSTFDILKVTADAVGPILKLIKRRIASNGQVLSGDIVGQLQVIGRANDSSNPVVANMKVVALENETASASGVYIAWETTPALSATAVEHMRLMNGFLGVGTVAPDAVIHGKGATGIKSEYIADTATPAKLTMQKSRLAGTGATQNADEIAELVVVTTDDTTAKVQSAGIKAIATEAHTTTARGTKLAFYTSPTGGTTPTSKMEIGDKVNPLATLKVTSLELDSQAVATAATIAQLSAVKAVVEFTGSTATDIQGINSGGATKTILIHNISTAVLTIKNEDAGAVAADRIKLPGANDVFVAAQKSIELWYSPSDSRWKVKAGFEAFSPMTATGDLTYGGVGGRGTRLAAGANGLYLGLSGGIPAWSSPAGTVAITAATTTYSVLTTDDVVTCSGASFTLTFPTAVGVGGKQYTIKHLGTSLTQVYTLATTSGQTIGGIASGSYALYTNQESIKVISDGANWQILDRFASVAPTAYTPTFTGFGTVSNVRMAWSRSGSYASLFGTITMGTTTATTPSFSFPGSMPGIDTAAITIGNTTGNSGCIVGKWTEGGTINGNGSIVTATGTNSSLLYFGQANSSSAELTPYLTNGWSVNSQVLSMNAIIPIDGWRP